MDVKIEVSWKEILKSEFNKPYFQQIPQHLKIEKSQGKVIYPPGSLIFNAFNLTPFDKLKVVILGQDFARQMEESFRRDLAKSKRITLEDWKRRSAGSRIMEGTARVWEYWL